MKKICIIDDDSKFIEFYIAILTQMKDIEIFYSENGEEGLKLIKTANPDMCILDYELPLFNGVNICKELRTIENFKNIPIILVSSSRIMGNKEKIFRDAGFDRWLEKPLNIPEFRSIVSELLML